MAETGYRPRFGKDIRIKPDAPKTVVTTRPCAIKGCKAEGGYRVPKNREQLNEHMWLCLAHVRAHNESWDYFNGMSEAQIEAFRVDAVTGHRPTWPLGKRAAGVQGTPGAGSVRDDFRVFTDEDEDLEPRRPTRHLTRLQAQAFDVLNLDANATLQEIKARYKELVKRFHPDANGGDRGAEERLKRVIQAYGVLRASGMT
jgi:hypothetical protein